jgi:glycosyltransferase involved in cell wall biosynthesis
MFQRTLQLNSYRRADGVIFLSKSARNIISKIIPDVVNKSTIIPHGISDVFRREPVDEKSESENKIELLYVSNIKSYKYQWNVVEAMSILMKHGYDNIKLTLVGPADAGPLKKLKSAIKIYEMRDRVVWLGAVPYEQTVRIYHNADIFVFATVCECCPNILLEAMASGLPIACSDRGPMKEFAKDGAKYFDPENPASIAATVRYLIDHHDYRKKLALRAYELSKKYTWENCTKQTFDFFWKTSGND